MAGHRNSRLNEQLKREISDILSRKVRDPRVGHVLITEVRVAGDLWVAKVFFRLLDADRDRREVAAGLEAAAPFVRKELGRILRIRRIPELRFQYDTTLDSALRIEEVLREVLPGDEGGQAGGDDGAPPGDLNQRGVGSEGEA
jgi:ribosome-binding factor A